MLDTPFPAFPDWRPRDEAPIRFHIPVSQDQPEKSRLAQERAANDIIQALSVWKVPTWRNTRYIFHALPYVEWLD